MDSIEAKVNCLVDEVITLRERIGLEENRYEVILARCILYEKHVIPGLKEDVKV